MIPLRSLVSFGKTVPKKDREKNKSKEASRPLVLPTPKAMGQTFYDFASCRNRDEREPGNPLPGMIAFFLIFLAGIGIVISGVEGFLHDDAFSLLPVIPGLLCMVLGAVGIVGIARYGKTT